MNRDYSLKKEKDFDLVFRKGTRVYANGVMLVYIESEQLKAGFAVGKKHGGSVQRNRIKRLLRESFRSFIPDISKNFFFVFIPKVKEEYSLEGFKKDMRFIFKKIGITEKSC